MVNINPEPKPSEPPKVEQYLTFGTCAVCHYREERMSRSPIPLQGAVRGTCSKCQSGMVFESVVVKGVSVIDFK